MGNMGGWTFTAPSFAHVRCVRVPACGWQMGITVSGSGVPQPAPAFGDIRYPNAALREVVLGNIEALEFSEPTAVQVCVPCVVWAKEGGGGTGGLG